MATVALLLAALALMGGAVAGVLDALKVQNVGPWKSFLIYVGVIGVASTTFAESMEILPLSLGAAGATGLVPFMLAYIGLRNLVAKLGRS